MKYTQVVEFVGELVLMVAIASSVYLIADVVAAYATGF